MIKSMTATNFEVTPAAWDRDADVLSQIRFTVFVREQGVPPEVEIDPADADESRVIHAIARDSNGQAIGTARMILEAELPRIGRMAVLRQWRSKGVGKLLLDFMCAEARRRGYREVMLHAQTHATAFYYRQGFLSHGSEFTEAGIPHQEMRRAL